jgi:Raf kinase inhibitor-like YbhB/YbcL family protein
MKVRPRIARLVEIRHVYALILLTATGCGGDAAPLPSSPPGLPTLKLTSPAFPEGGTIPKAFTCDGADKSPPLQWSGIPEAARSLALICDDPDAPRGTWSHWVVFNLPPDVTSLEEGIASELAAATGPQPSLKQALRSTRQGKNDFGKIGYGGPCPPSGSHRYVFRLYALDRGLDVPAGATRAEVLRAIDGHIVAEGKLTGKYARGS